MGLNSHLRNFHFQGEEQGKEDDAYSASPSKSIQQPPIKFSILSQTGTNILFGCLRLPLSRPQSVVDFGHYMMQPCGKNSITSCPPFLALITNNKKGQNRGSHRVLAASGQADQIDAQVHFRTSQRPLSFTMLARSTTIPDFSTVGSPPLVPL